MLQGKKPTKMEVWDLTFGFLFPKRQTFPEVEHPEPDHHPNDRGVQRPCDDDPDRAEPPADQHKVQRPQQKRPLPDGDFDQPAGLCDPVVAARRPQRDRLRQPVEHEQAERQANDRDA